jgi:hypothetical protein
MIYPGTDALSSRSTTMTKKSLVSVARSSRKDGEEKTTFSPASVRLRSYVDLWSVSGREHTLIEMTPETANKLALFLLSVAQAPAKGRVFLVVNKTGKIASVTRWHK